MGDPSGSTAAEVGDESNWGFRRWGASQHLTETKRTVNERQLRHGAYGLCHI